MKTVFFVILLTISISLKSFSETPTITNATPTFQIENVNNQNPYASNFNTIGQKYGISPLLLYSIAYKESSLNPKAVNHNANGSYDYGLMQINSSNLAGLGLNTTSVFDIDNNINAGAKVLLGCMNKFGANWLAVDCYNKGYNRSILSENSAYVRQVRAIFESISKTGLLADAVKIVKEQEKSENHSWWFQYAVEFVIVFIMIFIIVQIGPVVLVVGNILAGTFGVIGGILGGIISSSKSNKGQK